jgi:hypothetical protein
LQNLQIENGGVEYRIGVDGTDAPDINGEVEGRVKGLQYIANSTFHQTTSALNSNNNNNIPRDHIDNIVIRHTGTTTRAAAAQRLIGKWIDVGTARWRCCYRFSKLFFFLEFICQTT